MPSFVVVAGADVEMSDLESGNGISARIDLNLHLAPPTAGDLLRLQLGSGPSGEEEQQQQQQQQQQLQQSQHQRQGGQEQGNSQQQRRILPRFGPGIHGVFLDLHQETDSEGSGNRVAGRPPVFSRVDDETLSDPHLMRAPFRHRIRRYARPVRIRDSRRLPEVTLPIRNNQAVEPKEKEQVKGGVEDTKESSIKAGKGVDNYECNICLEVAADPVLTVCGHLFCWQCLYQWLYVHSDNEECPVCKGWVGENSIIPIYGRGSTPSEPQEQTQADESRGALPPRPHARRMDSPRQTLLSQFEADTMWDERVLEHGQAGVALPPRPHHRRGSDNRHRVISMLNERSTGLNEMLRMGRAIRLLSSRARLRRRINEREQQYRAATTELETTLSSDELPLSLSRAEGIQARLANLVETIESHRRAAASMVARLQETDISAGQQQTGTMPPESAAPTPAAGAGTTGAGAGAGVGAPGAGTGTDSTSTSSRGPSLTVLSTGEAAEHTCSASRREVGEGSGTSGSDDIDIDPEVLHCRKRRRLN